MVIISVNDLNLDNRVKQTAHLLNYEGFDCVVVKGVAWNKGRLLTGADFDFYVSQDGNHVPFTDLSDDLQKEISDLFPGVLVMPRIDDFKPDKRLLKYFVDVEMTLKPEGIVDLCFANQESSVFYNEGIYDLKFDFVPNRDQLIFVLNRFLEEGSNRRLGESTYSRLKSFSEYGSQNL